MPEAREPGYPTTIIPPDGMPVNLVAMLQATIDDAWQEYGGDPYNAEQFWNHMIGLGAADVPRETSGDSL